MHKLPNYHMRLNKNSRLIARKLCAQLVCTLVISGCAPAHVRLDEYASRLGFQRALVQSDEFTHVVYRNQKPSFEQPLHVYLDGDGSPWIDREWVARDPTPKSKLVLNLMSLDPSPAIYLGRPCYHGLSTKPPCEPVLWTHLRYSERVVNSLAGALKKWRHSHPFSGMVLIGYSGGGTLAMLLSERVTGLRGVITLAGNLAVADWAKFHGFSDLSGSLDPSSLNSLPPDILQVHLAGARDANIPPDLIKPFIKRQTGAQLIIFDRYSHTCCWEAIWPSALASIQRHQKYRSENPAPFK